MQVAWSPDVANQLMEWTGARGIPHVVATDADGNVVYEGHPKDADFAAMLPKVCHQPPPDLAVSCLLSPSLEC